MTHSVFYFLLSLRCLKFLGSRHPTLVLPLVPELLSTHPYFDTPEPDMDDPACILQLMLIQLPLNYKQHGPAEPKKVESFSSAVYTGLYILNIDVDSLSLIQIFHLKQFLSVVCHS